VTPAETLAKSKQLDRFLGKAVTDIKASDRTAMDRFAELAARSAKLHKAAEDRADRFEARLDAIPDLLERAFAPQEAKLDDLERGAEVLENSLQSMIGHNGGPLEVSPPAVLPSPPVVPPVVEVLPPEPAPPVAEVQPVVPPPVPVLDPTANGNAA
jgi:hypothetical protein